MKWFLDFGHGGKDSGAVGTKHTKESDVVLKIGMIIKENLEKHNQQVITTRQNDKYYSLDYRSKKANENKCDYFVSIHMNAATNKLAKGCEVWVYDEKSKVYTLSKNICTNLSKAIKTKMPALLIEIDFISNPSVESNLASEKYIKDISSSISSTLLSFANNL